MITIAYYRCPASRSPSRVSAAFRAALRFIVMLAVSGPRMRALRRLSEISDEDLAARCLTREGEVRRILGGAAAF